MKKLCIIPLIHNFAADRSLLIFAHIYVIPKWFILFAILVDAVKLKRCQYFLQGYEGLGRIELLGKELG